MPQAPGNRLLRPTPLPADLVGQVRETTLDGSCSRPAVDRHHTQRRGLGRHAAMARGPAGKAAATRLQGRLAALLPLLVREA
ncbi:MAG: hypothetical protein IPO59_09010, partial [Betaproteobacteria bacterium]|nr:hypothetical protein [Betaproteobacteria bacterium]